MQITIENQHLFAQIRHHSHEKAGFVPKGTIGSYFIPFSINISSLTGWAEIFVIKGQNINSPVQVMKIGLICLFIFFTITSANADNLKRLQKKANKASTEFAQKASEGSVYKFRFDTALVDQQAKKVNLKMKEGFSYFPFRPENTTEYYNWYKELLGRKFRSYSISIESMGKEISELIPNYYRDQTVAVDASRLSQPTKPKLPIVRNISGGTNFTEGLSNRNIALWHSHGWYYENTLDRWEWQRARVFLTVEDIWTMDFVVPYITPMLENAGANVFIPRERDTQKHELIIDSDGSTKGCVYQETGEPIQTGKENGFGL
ncbi:MAG: hypothetical protein Q8P34_09810, partial [Bacteroidota bacterium]|nr:hypothetical protein [Bacteroidota bacterium]